MEAILYEDKKCRLTNFRFTESDYLCDSLKKTK